MSRRRNRRGSAVNESRPHPPPLSPMPLHSPGPPPSVSVLIAGCSNCHVVDAMKGIIERAADRVRSDLPSTGEIRPMAFFVCADGTMKVVSFSLKNEVQKDALIRKIREKAVTENTSAIVVLTEAEHKRNGMIVLSGVSPGVSASARVDYSFDKETKTVTSWNISWLDQPVQNVFLDGIFDKTG